MANKRLTMRKIQDVLRLHAAGQGLRAIAHSIQASPSTVGDYIRRAKVAGVGWPLPAGMSETELEHRLFPPPIPSGETRPLPDFPQVHADLKRKGVTLALLWQEYKADYPDGLQYSQFCDRYRLWQGKLGVVMRQTHRAGEKLFVDYAGQRVPIVDPRTGEVREAEVFVAVLGASNYTFAEATWSQALPDWIGSHVRAFAFIGGVPEIVVPDNLRSGVSKAHRYEPDINPTYQEMAAHYGVAVIPARARKPRDKAKAEAGVLLVERWILAALRKQTFFSLAELNAAIRELLIRLNERPFKKLPGSRREQFETLEKPALRPLSAQPYQFAEWKKVRVHLDYHVELAGHYYSVPYALVKSQLDARLTATTAELFHKGKRVASHVRSYVKGQHTTLAEHMPPAHREHGQWTPRKLIVWGESIGPGTGAFVTTLIEGRSHPQQGVRSALGVLRLAKSYGNDRLEAACQRALIIGARSYRSLASMLQHGLDQRPLSTDNTPSLPADHDNVRGAGYYH
jgi:transposase